MNTCPGCGGDGKIFGKCQACFGTGERFPGKNCIVCGGDGIVLITCPTCRGRKRV